LWIVLTLLFAAAGNVFPLVKAEGVQGAGSIPIGSGDYACANQAVAYDDSGRPLRGETDDRIVYIQKIADEAKEEISLENVCFRIYEVAALTQPEQEQYVLPAQPTQADIRRYAVPGYLVATVTTNAAGVAAFNLTRSGLPDGVYLVEEQPGDSAAGMTDPFFIMVPGAAGENCYRVCVSPPKIVETRPNIQMDVTRLDNDSDSFDVLTPHIWIIRGDLPAGLGDAREYVISTTLDGNLTYKKGSTVVKLWIPNAQEEELTRDIHYYLSESKQSDGLLSRDHIRVSLTREGMKRIGARLEEGTQIPQLRVYYEAVINENVRLGIPVSNHAELSYVNSNGKELEAKADAAQVFTGGIHLRKTDVQGNPLAGATLRIAREATLEELTDPECRVEKLYVKGRLLDVVFVSFVPGDDLAEAKVDAITTGEDGNAAFCGLAYGTYYIVETKAPSGYNLLSDPIEARINSLSHKADQELDSTIWVVSTRFALPKSNGTTLFTVLGLTVLGYGALMLFLNHKKGII